MKNKKKHSNVAMSYHFQNYVAARKFQINWYILYEVFQISNLKSPNGSRDQLVAVAYR